MSISNEIKFTPGIVVDYLLSETLAFPLASVCSFKNSVINFDASMRCKKNQRLWRDAERHILSMIPDVSVDMVLAIRDQFWFGDVQQQGMHAYLRRIAGEFLEASGDTAVPRFTKSLALISPNYHTLSARKKNNTLRWFSFAFPMDMLLGALDSPGQAPFNVDYISPQIFTDLRDKGFVEPHLHLGAAMEFPEFWVMTLNGLAEYGFEKGDFKSPGAEFREGADMGFWLLKAALVRTILARFFYCDGPDFPDFFSWLEHSFFPSVFRDFGTRARTTIELVFHDVLSGRNEKSNVTTAYLLFLYRQLSWFGRPPELHRNPDFIFLSDPIAKFMNYSPNQHPSPEIQFVRMGISYLDKRSKDTLLSGLFWQVLRLRCIYYRHVVQRPMTPGLLWFVRHYDRGKHGRRLAPAELLIRSAARTCGYGKGLRSLEVRAAPKGSVSETLHLLDECVYAIHGLPFSGSLRDMQVMGDPLFKESLSLEKPEIEFGLVIHFTKNRGENTQKGLGLPRWENSNADPRPSNKKWVNRFARFYTMQRMNGRVLAKTLFRFPLSLQLIRGLDICTDELGVPSWVFVPIFRYIRDAGIDASMHLQAKFGRHVPPLRTTIHTGEDFIHLLGGLRRVEETIRYFNLGPGDRLGHAMALGMDPAVWAGKKHRVAMTREDRLFDLVWEWGRYSTGLVECSPARRSFLEREISRLSDTVFMTPKTPYELEHLLNDLHDEGNLKNVGYPQCRKLRIPKKSLEKRLEFLLHYLTCKACFERGHKTEWVHVENEIEPMQQLQKHIRERVAGIGIVVEVNPTSNLLIGNLTDLKHHPFWRLKSPMHQSEGQSVALCIGSDDPLTFATNLRHEYVLLYESLVEGGLSSSDAWEWVEQVRATGMKSRFTLPVDQFKHDWCQGAAVLEFPRHYHRRGSDRHMTPMP
ncbi:hypothetical protein [Desulfoluna sp.]|uniref:hypothetical protein n=1 Tax=Desulfoluna sp. TaxID=2045199 RepID=UPI0026172F34|nr:hypothetical protein [Desulfoluna sp.]